MDGLRDRIQSVMSSFQADLRSNPGKWTGIAAGAGFGLGLVGQMMRHRHRRIMPDLVIIDVC